MLRRPRPRENRGDVKFHSQKWLNPMAYSRARQPIDHRKEAPMSSVMIRCPATGTAIPTGIKADRASYQRTPVFMARTYCPICATEHEWFAKEAWVAEPHREPRSEAA
jgi:hypothetical protein